MDECRFLPRQVGSSPRFATIKLRFEGLTNAFLFRCSFFSTVCSAGKTLFLSVALRSDSEPSASCNLKYYSTQTSVA